ncbi:hypothetical protein SDC9_159784 [bioreactor metagenome]|uniref:Uncharacterized protein n=1 Tax=bioreactor metagenome TaxID=1076179 RepID=A0A645FFT4_9ZZZZ
MNQDNDLPDPDAEIEVLTHGDHREINVDGWNDALPDGVYRVYTEQSVRTLLEAAAQHSYRPGDYNGHVSYQDHVRRHEPADNENTLPRH